MVLCEPQELLFLFKRILYLLQSLFINRGTTDVQFSIITQPKTTVIITAVDKTTLPAIANQQEIRKKAGESPTSHLV